MVSVNELTRGPRFIGEAMKFLFQRKGLLTLSAAHIAVFCKSRPDLAHPDIQYHILPATMDAEKLANAPKREIRPPIRPSSPTTWPTVWTRRSPSPR